MQIICTFGTWLLETHFEDLYCFSREDICSNEDYHLAGVLLVDLVSGHCASKMLTNLDFEWIVDQHIS